MHEKRHDNLVLLAKYTLKISFYIMVLIDSYINHGKFFPVNNVLREYDEIKKVSLLIKN